MHQTPTGSANFLRRSFYRLLKVMPLMLLLFIAVPAFAVSVTSFSPASGPVGTLVTVKGTGFTSASTVTIGGKPAIVISFTDTQIVGMVMPGAVTGKVTVNSGSEVNSRTNFKIIATSLPLSFSPDKLVDNTVQPAGKSLKDQGYAVAISADGSTAAVTAYSLDVAESGVKFYSKADGGWVASSAFIRPKGLTVTGGFGYSVALNGDGSVAVVGSFGRSNGFNNVSGDVYVFVKKQGYWSKESVTRLDAPGSSVGITADGNTIITGRIGYVFYPGDRRTASVTNPNDAVNLYQRSGLNSWNQIQVPTRGSRAVPGEAVGISPDGTVIVMKARYQGFTTPNSSNPSFESFDGYIDAFVRSTAISDDWHQSEVVDTDDGTNKFSFSADGGYLAYSNGQMVSIQKKTGYGYPGAYARPITIPGNAAALSADGKTLVIGADGLRVYGWKNGKFMVKGAAGKGFNADGVAMSANAGEVFYGNANDAPLGAVYTASVAPQLPVVDTSVITFDNITPTTTSINWTIGTGTGRTVFIKQTTAGEPVPGNISYAANRKYRLGDEINTSGWYCIYNGNGNRVDVTGLADAKTYRVAVLEYNGTPQAPQFLMADVVPANITTPKMPAEITFDNITATTTTVTWAKGTGIRRAVFIKDTTAGEPSPANVHYLANKRYGMGNEVGKSGWYCIYNGSGYTVDVTGLTNNKNYRVAVMEYKGTLDNPLFLQPWLTPADLTTLKTPPAEYATALTFTNTTGAATTLSWINGGGSKRAVFLKLGTAGIPAPVNGIIYEANATFGQGTAAGTGWYCVYNGTGSSVDITGLAMGGTYTASVVEYNGDHGGQTYEVTGVVGQMTTPVEPPTEFPWADLTQGAEPLTMANLSIDQPGSVPAGYAIFMKLSYDYNALYSEDHALPANLPYAANSKFGAGEQIDNTGWFCVYNGKPIPSGTYPTITGLKGATSYLISVVPYNGSKTNPVYAIDASPMQYTTTVYKTGEYYPPPPSVAAAGLKFSKITETSCTISWVNGNGQKRLVLLSPDQYGEPELYDGSPIFATSNPYTEGAGGAYSSENARWYAVYNGTGNSVNLTGLSPATKYRVMVIEYNLVIHRYSSSYELAIFLHNYPTAGVTTLTPGAPPTGYATALTFNNTTATTTTLSWLSSNGSARAVFLHLGTTGAISIVQGQTYTANNIFNKGTQAGSNGWYCVYNGTGSSVDISGLAATSTYRAIVLEYNGTAGAESYNLSRYNGANVTTTAAPILLLATAQKQMLIDQDVAGNAELNIHQGLSPNGDGLNDVFTIDGIGAYPENTVKILNSNGEAIYSANGYNNLSKAFDGHADNGVLQKAGTYFYSVEYKKGAEVIRKTGYLILKY